MQVDLTNADSFQILSRNLDGLWVRFVAFEDHPAADRLGRGFDNRLEQPTIPTGGVEYADLADELSRRRKGHVGKEGGEIVRRVVDAILLRPIVFGFSGLHRILEIV